MTTLCNCAVCAVCAHLRGVPCLDTADQGVDATVNKGLTAFQIQDVEGLVLVYDSEGASAEAELERMYKAFAQKHALTRGQCLVLAVNCSGAFSSGKGLTGRLQALKQVPVEVQLSSPHSAAQQVKSHVDQLVARCASLKGREVEDAVVASEA